MGVSWSSVSDCLGDISGSSNTRYNRVPPSRRVEQSSTTSRTDRTALRQRYLSDEKQLAISVASPGAAIAPPPPPLIPDSNAVYNLLEDEDEDVCPTCLETYEKDNPKIVSRCGHAFHLQCIVAWETRSGTRFCPICAKVMEYVEAQDKIQS
ncbi:E3 ubiquitin-protein ligase [Gracilariopsis chorda]|uniref:RING-type E3 ubiquitin transferase n=1 Tax=Gracilariopsis chorda TaxID=448386 RepID=A0A2V3IND1_9FLOR|nr:E3 ubiquitin-protein ligase [Gracilariopsis chorda]|eukprot:PXF43588.1 E3 ubiquitin-protein ligase [Gracilariopsis chorda]